MPNCSNTYCGKGSFGNPGRGYDLGMPEDDSFLRALSDLSDALDANVARVELIKRQIAEIQRERAAGKSYREIVSAENDDTLVVKLVSQNLRTLDDVGARVRRTKALVLHNEGMTMDQIAAKFGVTRQRVSRLLREARSDPR